jgi:hypothetical protein
MGHSENAKSDPHQRDLHLKKLTVEQVEQIDDLLASLEDYGEIHLIVQRGQLRYVNRVESHKAWTDEESG